MSRPKWYPITVSNPPPDQLCWLRGYSAEKVWLGCRTYVENEGIFWAESNGMIEVSEGMIASDCYLEDISPTHYSPLPKL